MAKAKGAILTVILLLENAFLLNFQYRRASEHFDTWSFGADELQRAYSMAATTKFAMISPASTGQISLLTVEEVAELLNVPVSWVYDRTRSRGMNRIPGFRLGKYWRFHESEVRAWLERQRSGTRANA